MVLYIMSCDSRVLTGSRIPSKVVQLLRTLLMVTQCKHEDRCEHFMTFNISFYSTQNKQQHGNKITCTEVKKVMVISKIITITILSIFYILSALIIGVDCILHL